LATTDCAGAPALAALEPSPDLWTETDGTANERWAAYKAADLVCSARIISIYEGVGTSDLMLPRSWIARYADATRVVYARPVSRKARIACNAGLLQYSIPFARKLCTLTEYNKECNNCPCFARYSVVCRSLR
jgi:hypothetical protein